MMSITSTVCQCQYCSSRTPVNCLEKSHHKNDLRWMLNDATHHDSQQQHQGLVQGLIPDSGKCWVSHVSATDLTCKITKCP